MFKDTKEILQFKKILVWIQAILQAMVFEVS